MSEKIKVLVADDEQFVLDFLNDLLSTSGFEVLKAVNGKEAIESISRDKPQVLLLDITMPDMDGFKTCEQIRKRPENDSLVIIMLTGDGHESAIVTALESGADDYVTKPFKNEELVGKIQSLIERAKSGVLPSQHYLQKIRGSK